MHNDGQFLYHVVQIHYSSKCHCLILLRLLSSDYKSNTTSESCPDYSSTKVEAKAFSLVVCESKLYLTFEFYSSVIVQTERPFLENRNEICKTCIF